MRYISKLKSRVKRFVLSHWWRYVANRTPKVFCISMQRTGTTSVERFLEDFGFQCAGWPEDERNGWSGAW